MAGETPNIKLINYTIKSSSLEQKVTSPTSLTDVNPDYLFHTSCTNETLAEISKAPNASNKLEMENSLENLDLNTIEPGTNVGLELAVGQKIIKIFISSKFLIFTTSFLSGSCAKLYLPSEGKQKVGNLVVNEENKTATEEEDEEQSTPAATKLKPQAASIEEEEKQKNNENNSDSNEEEAKEQGQVEEEQYRHNSHDINCSGVSEHEHELEKINNIDTHRPHTSLEHDTRLEQRLEEAENNIERDDKKEEEKSLIAPSNENSLADRLQRLYIKKFQNLNTVHIKIFISFEGLVLTSLTAKKENNKAHFHFLAFLVSIWH